MEYRQILVRGLTAEAVTTEIMYEVAGVRSAGSELLRININKTDDEKSFRRVVSAAVKVLKGMKEQGKIQVFATPKSFEDTTMEAQFLINKYPELLQTVSEETSDATYIYVKL